MNTIGLGKVGLLNSKPKAVLIALLTILLMTTAGISWAQDEIQDNPFFELDGDAIPGNSLVPREDWENVHEGIHGQPGQPPPSGTDLSTADVSLFVDDQDSSADNIFTGGGSKDDLDVPNWLHDDSGTVPDKDDLKNAFAALYDDFLFFGATRFTTNGDAQVGFWFFQQGVGPEPGGLWSGQHETGDILVLSDFVNGGSISEIKVYEWFNPACDEANPDVISCDSLNLGLLFEGVDCQVAPEQTEFACATVNQVELVTDWNYIAKGNNSIPGVIPVGGFYEGGLDLSAFPNLRLGCNATFLAETRSSQSLDAVLKDYVWGTFESCSIEVLKSGPDLTKIGDDTTYSFMITNTNATTLYLKEVIDSVFGDITAAAAANPDCLILAADESCVFDVPYIVDAGDPDPLENTVMVIYNSAADGTEDDVDAMWSHTAELFQPSVTIDKTGDELSKAGDSVTYTFTINNTSSPDTPDLVLKSISDTILGDLSVAANGAVCGTLASGASCNFNVVREVLSNDPDPLVNTVTVNYNPDGFPNNVGASDSHSVDLFGPSVEIIKSGDTLSKIGDEVTYSFTINNTSEAGTPDLTLVSITDNVLGDLSTAASAAGCATLATGASCNFNATRTTVEGDPDPLDNTVTVMYNPVGYTNNVWDDDNHSVQLFQPSVTIDKTGDTLSKVGDEVTYTFTVNNTSSADSPNLVLVSMIDDVLGDLTTAATGAGCANLAPAANCNFNVMRTVLSGDADPLNNTVTVMYNPDGYPNDVSSSDGHSVNLFQPSVSIDKTGDTLSKVGDSVDYTITVTNTSSADSPNLTCTITDVLLGIDKQVNLAPAAIDITNASRVVMAGDADPLPNTANVNCTVDDFGNAVNNSDGHSVNLFQPGVEILKDGDDYAKAGDTVTYTFTINNLSSEDSPNLVISSVSDSVLGNLTGDATTACGSLTLAFEESCEFSVDYTIAETATADEVCNTANVTADAQGFTNNLDEDSNEHCVDLVYPDIDVAKSCLNGPVQSGSSANFQIDVTNTGDTTLFVDVTDIVLGIAETGIEMPSAGIGCIYDADPSDGCLRYETGIIAGTEDILNTVDVVGNLPPETLLTNTVEATADATCEVRSGGATRTRGFWQTHGSDGLRWDVPVEFGYTCHVLEVHLGLPVSLGWVSVENCADALGVFWANNARETTRDRRDKLCQANTNASKQLMAAILNSGLDNGASVPIDPITTLPITDALVAELAKGQAADRKEVLRLHGLLGEYNESGDAEAIIDLDGAIIPPADPRGVRDYMDTSVTDCPW